MPVAVKACVVPLAILGLAGLMVMLSNTAAFTVKLVLPDTPLKVALMVVVPVPALLAKPCEPTALEMVATPVSDDPQVTSAVRSC